MHAKPTFSLLLWILFMSVAGTAQTVSPGTHRKTLPLQPDKRDPQRLSQYFREANTSHDVGKMLECIGISIDWQMPLLAGTFLSQGQETFKEKADSAQLSFIHFIDGRVQTHKGLHKQAIGSYERSLALGRTMAHDTLAGYVYLGIGQSYWLMRNYPQAIEYFELSHNFAVKHLNEPLRLEALSRKGEVYAQIANYPKAIELQLLVNELAIKHNYKRLIATSYDQAGLIYLQVGQTQKAHDAFKEALSIFRESQDSAHISSCLAHLGETFLKMGNTPQAVDLTLQSLRISEQLGDTLAICTTQLYLGQIEFRNKRLQQAVKHYLKALELMKHKEDVSLMAAIRFNLGEVFLALGNTAAAHDYLVQAAQTAGELGERELMAKCYNTLSSAYEQRADYVNALKAKNEFALIKDSVLNEQTIEYIARMDAIYRSINKENIIKTLKAQNDSAAKSLASQQTAKESFLVVIVVLAVTAIALFAAFRIKQTAGRKLARMNNELSHLNATKDKFFSIISHDLKSPINSLMGFTEMIVLHAEAGHYEKLGEFGQMAHNNTKKLYNLVDNLLLWSRTQVGTTPYQPQHIDVGIQCQNIIALLRLSGEEKDIVINGKLEKNLTAFADVNLFNTVLRNLISNAVKFSPVGATVTVTTKKQDGHVLVSVADTGVGIAKANIGKLFLIDSNYSTLGTFNEKGSGLGLILCKEFVEINKGSIGVESEEGKGSMFYFTVPLAIKNVKS
ncbi:MAG: tetratricopeptide repeat protein [Breznakibacter sp.]